MRKYIRLSLCIIAGLSCLLMLIYRYKYSHLSIVVQMMNSFTNENAVEKCNSMQNFGRLGSSDWHTAETSAGYPSWTEIFPNIYQYSTFWVEQKSRTLVFTRSTSISMLEKFKCDIWFENTKNSTEGKTKVQMLYKKSNSLLLLVECEPDFNYKKPYGIRFHYKNLSSLVQPIISEKYYLGEYSACVEPLPLGYQDVYGIAEFLIYHSHIGIRHFVFYDTGLSPTVKALLLEVAPRSNILVTLLPWNVPYGFTNVSYNGKEYFVDCLHRIYSRNSSDYVVKLDVNQFIVPRTRDNITALFLEMESTADFYRLYESKFCWEYVDDIIAHNLNIPFKILLKTKAFASVDVSFPIFFKVRNSKQFIHATDFKFWLDKAHSKSNTVLPKDEIRVHTYKNCSLSVKILENGGYINDKYLWKYKNQLFKSNLYSFVKHNIEVEA